NAPGFAHCCGLQSRVPSVVVRLLSCGRTNLAAPRFNLGLNGVTHGPRPGEFFVVRAGKTGRVGETPMQPDATAGKNGTTFRARFVANGDDVRKWFSRLDEIRHRLGGVAGDVDADFPHGLDD